MNAITKKEFLALLKNALIGLSPQEISESINFYNEMISDRMEDGLSEEEAVAEIGSVSKIAAQIKAEKSSHVIEKPAAPKTKKRSATSLTLIILGSPIWISLLAALFAVIVSVFVTVLSVGAALIITAIVLAIVTVVLSWTLWIVISALEISLLAVAVSGLVCFVPYALTDRLIHGTFILGASLVCSGLSVLAFPLCRKTLPLLISFTKKFSVESMRVAKNSFTLIGSSIKNATVSIISTLRKGY